MIYVFFVLCRYVCYFPKERGPGHMNLLCDFCCHSSASFVFSSFKSLDTDSSGCVGMWNSNLSDNGLQRGAGISAFSRFLSWFSNASSEENSSTIWSTWFLKNAAIGVTTDVLPIPTTPCSGRLESESTWRTCPHCAPKWNLGGFVRQCQWTVIPQHFCLCLHSFRLLIRAYWKCFYSPLHDLLDDTSHSDFNRKLAIILKKPLYFCACHLVRGGTTTWFLMLNITIHSLVAS